MANLVNEVDVFGLFDALYKNGHAKLSDHFVSNEPSKQKESVCHNK